MDARNKSRWAIVFIDVTIALKLPSLKKEKPDNIIVKCSMFLNLIFRRKQDYVLFI